MPATDLVRPVSAIVLELRHAWASGRRVALSLDADEHRVEGFVERVAASGAWVRVNATHVPATAILAVHLPARTADSTARPTERFHRGAHPLLRHDARQERLA